VAGPMTANRLVEGVASFVLGLIVGAIGTFGHQLTRELGVPIPLGLIAALVAVVCLLAGLRLATESRILAALAALGIVVAVGVLALPSANGSVLLPDNIAGIAWAIGPTLIAVVVLGWPRIQHGPNPGVRSGSGE